MSDRHAWHLWHGEPGVEAPGTSRTSRQLLAAGFVLLCVFLLVVAVQLGSAVFTPDSWAYLELSKTVFGGDFYRFNTYRSYFGTTHSAAFPLGYPVALALVQKLTGLEVLAGVALNGVTALATWLLIIHLGRLRGLSPLVSGALASSLALSPFYLDEVFAGRALPLALLLFLLSLRASLASRSLLAGLLLGAAALVRFDYLVYGCLWLATLAVLDWRRPGRVLLTGLGFGAGLLPWVVYSQLHFGKAWVSDNAWVALSVAPAFVLDYPASAALTVFQAPAAWGQRVAGNIVPLVQSLAAAAVNFPLVLVLLGSVLCHGTSLPARTVARLVIAGMALLVSLLPYLCTGYVDKRYFALVLLLAAASFALALKDAKARPSPLRVAAGASTVTEKGPWRLEEAAILASLLLSAMLALNYIGKRIGPDAVHREPAAVAQLLARLDACHAQQPQVTYIFKDAHVNLAPRHGALTGRPSAFIPSNFHRMSDAEQEAYLARMRPYALVDQSLEPHQCPQVR